MCIANDVFLRDNEAGCSDVAEGPCEPSLWNNRAFEISRQNAGGKEKAFDKRLEKLAQVKHHPLPTTRTHYSAVAYDIVTAAILYWTTFWTVWRHQLFLSYGVNII